MPSTWMFRISCGSTSRGASDRFPAQAVAVATAAGPRIALREIRLAGDSSKRRGAGCEELEVGTGAGHRQPEPRLEPQTRIPGPRPRTHGPGTRATTRGSARRRSHARAAFLLCARRIPLSSPWACHRRLPYSEGWSPCVPHRSHRSRRGCLLREFRTRWFGGTPRQANAPIGLFRTTRRSSSSHK